MYGADASGAAEAICVVQIALQVFVAAAAVATRDATLLKPELLAHHAVTAALMVQCLRPFHGGGGLFGTSRVAVFFGLTEVSTVPLLVVDVLKAFPALRARHATLDLGAKVLFAAAFLVVRVGVVTVHCVGFQRDVFAVVAAGDAHSLATLAFFSVANVFLVGLQFYWASLILKRAAKTLAGAADDKGE